MAVDNHCPDVTSSPVLASAAPSSSSSSSGSFFDRQRRLIQVATNNSSTFIQFPNGRQSSTLVPIGRPTTANSISSTRPSLLTADTQSLSSKSKFSTDAPRSSIKDRAHSHQRVNPILNNPLLNHRKEQPKPLIPIFTSSEFSRPSRPCFSSKPLGIAQHHDQSPIIRASTAPILPHRSTTEETNKSSNFFLPFNDEHQQHYVDKNKYDYITRWLNEVRAATRCAEQPLVTKSKRSKRRLIQQ